MNPLRLITVCLFSSIAWSADASGNYSLPFDGVWFVGAAGDTPNVNHHVSVVSQYYAMDFIRVQDRSPIKQGDGSHLEDYYSFGSQVKSPVDGIVVSVENSMPDLEMGNADKESAFGNHVVIKVNEKEFCFLAHFKKGSITSHVGDVVKSGIVLGLCGNSGNTTNPHVHMHVQDTMLPYTGNALRVKFKKIDVELTGEKFKSVSWPLITGLFVSNPR